MNQSHTPVTLTRLRGPLATTLFALSLAPLAHSADFTWTAGSGDWGNSANWADGNIANGAGDRAIFATSGGGTVDLGTDTWTVGFLDFTNLWTLDNGTIHLDNGSSTAEIRAQTNGSTVINAVLTGSNGFVKRGGGSRSLVLGGNNTYSGATRIAEGQMEIRHDNALGASTGANDYTLIDHTGGNYPQLSISNNITVAEEFRLRLYAVGTNGSNNTHLVSNTGSNNTLTGPIYLDRAGGGTGQYNFRIQAQGGLTIDGEIRGRLTDPLSSGSSVESRIQLSTTANGNIRVNGVIADGTLANYGGLKLINDGPGTLTLTAANTYSGGTIILNNTTLVAANSTGSATGTGSIEARTGTTLRGNGIIAPETGMIVFQSGARVLPGNGDVAGEKLTFDLSGVSDPQYIVDFQSGATIGIDISAANGASYLVFAGLSFQDQVVFNNNVVDFNLLGGTPLADGLYTLAQFTGDGSYNGEWVLGSGLEAYSDVELLFSDNSILLRVGVIPEPGTWAAIFAGVALVSCVVLKRRKR